MSTPTTPPTPTIEVVVDPQGNLRLQTKGFLGPACRQASAALEAALGAVQSERPTAEFYQSQPVVQQQRQRF